MTTVTIPYQYQPRMKVNSDYLAGFIDGEGCISIYRMNTTNGRTGSWQPRIVITNTNLSILQAIRETYGGQIKRAVGRKEGWKEAYHLELYTSNLDKIVPILEGRLIIKAPQLALVKQLRALTKRTGTKKFTEGDIMIREQLRIAIQKLNKRGDGSDNNPL